MSRTARRANPYFSTLVVAFRGLVALNGWFFQYRSASTHRARELRRAFKASPLPEAIGGHATLLIRDITADLSERWSTLFPIGAHVRFGRRYLKAIDEIDVRVSAWTVAQAFEVFETFLLDIVAGHLMRRRGYLRDAIWMKGRRRLTSAQAAPRRLNGHQAYVRSAYHGAGDVLRRLRQTIPIIGTRERDNNLSVDLQEWLAAAAAVRHAAVHAHAIISPAQMEKLGPSRRRALTTHFPGRLTKRGYRLLLDERSTDAAIRQFAEHAFLVFKAVSQHDGYDYLVFREMRIRE